MNSLLIKIVTNDVMDETVVNSICTAENLSIEQKSNFLAKLIDNPASFYESITKKNLPLMSKSKNNSIGKSKKEKIKEKLRLFFDLYIATQVRGDDIWTTSFTMT